MIKLHVPIDHYIILYLKIMTAIVEFNKQPNPNLSTILQRLPVIHH